MFIDILLIVLLFALFGASHSILASDAVKKRIANAVGEKIAFYRLFYNISSVIILGAVLALAPKPNVSIYTLPYPYDIAAVVLEILSLVGFIISAKQLDEYEFIGLRQIKRYTDKQYDPATLDEISKFTAKGQYKYCRHPLYFYSILFLGFRPAMDLFYLTAYICIVIYFLIGIYFEEKRMVERFGNEYINYQKSVPMLNPLTYLIKKREIQIETKN